MPNCKFVCGSNNEFYLILVILEVFGQKIVHHQFIKQKKNGNGYTPHNDTIDERMIRIELDIAFWHPIDNFLPIESIASLLI